MIIGFGNNVVSSLAADITASQTTIQVMPGAGAMFANLLTSDYANSSNPLKTYAKITLTDAKETVFEVCHLTTVNNDMLTVIRGQEGTTAKGWSLNDVIANFATRGSENQFVQIEELQSGHYVAGVAGGTENNLTLELPATYFVNGGADWTLRTPLVVIPALNNTGASTLQLTMGGRVLGIFPLYKGNKAELSANDIIKDAPVLCVLDNTKTYFSVLNPLEIYLGSRYLQKDQNLADVPDKALARQSLQLGNSATRNVGTTVDTVAAGDDSRITGAMQKDQNGGDIPDKDLFARRIGAARAFDGAVTVGGDANPWTTVEFIAWLENCGAFNHPYWMCKGSWDYAGNKVITDTGCGNICLAGAVIEVMGTRGAMTVRVTTPTTTSGGGVPSAQFTYINHGDGYAPGWRREFSRTGDEMTGNLCLKSDGRVNFGVMNEDGTSRMWLYKDKGGDGIHINNGNDGGGDYVFHKDGSFYAPLAVRAGGSKKLAVRSDNNSALSAHFNLWGDANRPTVIELDDDQGWHLYSQRNPDGSIRFMVNGDIFTTGSIHAGANTISTDGNIYGSIWGGWLSDWLNNNKAAKSTASLATNGWFRDASTGWIYQWGIVPFAGSTTITVNLPTPFPVGAFMAMGVPASALYWGEDGASGSAAILNNSQLRVTTDNSLPTAWIAIGH
ncbi:gp53-like domain-containing protein [Salmonella enterica]